MPHFITPDFVCMSSLLALNEKKSNTKQCPCAVKKVLADFAVCGWWRYFKALCDVKFSKIAENCRKFGHLELCSYIFLQCGLSRRFILPHNLKGEELTCSLGEDGKLHIKGTKIPRRQLSISGSDSSSGTSGSESGSGGSSGSDSGSGGSKKGKGSAETESS